MPLIHIQIEDELLKQIDHAVEKLDSDRSKFIRNSARYYLRSIETLPHPADAEVIPVVNVSEEVKS